MIVRAEVTGSVGVSNIDCHAVASTAIRGRWSTVLNGKAPYIASSHQVATPALSPPPGTYTVPQSVAISCLTQGAAIYYTTNGSEPSEASTPYTGAIIISETTTLKAKAFKSGYLASEIASSIYTIELVLTPATPTITRDSAGVYSIACATDGATIYYTLDGTDPDADATEYSTALSIIFPQTLKAIAIKDSTSSEIATLSITESVWTIAASADGTKKIRIRCLTTGQTLTTTGGAEITLTAGGEWVTSVELPNGASNRDIYFRGNGVGGNLLIPSPQNVTYLHLSSTGTSITGSINGMALTFLVLSSTGTSITGSINGMELTLLYLNLTGTNITGTPTQIGTPLNSMQILGGNTYDYPWTSQTFGGTKIAWTSATMAIDCVAAAPTPAKFDTWLLGLASVSKAATATLTLKNTPTVDAMIAAGLVGPGSGYYAMTTTLGYTLTLGT